MFFQTEMNKTKYDLSVVEHRTKWVIGIKKEDDENWRHEEIDKNDYQHMDGLISFLYKDSSYLVDVDSEDTNYSVYARGSFRNLKLYNDEMLLHESLKTGKGMSSNNDLVSGMPGKIVKIFVKPGQEVKEGDPLLVMEAMKMENEMRSSQDGIIAEVKVAEADTVEGGATLITFEKEK